MELPRKKKIIDFWGVYERIKEMKDIIVHKWEKSKPGKIKTLCGALEYEICELQEKYKDEHQAAEGMSQKFKYLSNSPFGDITSYGSFYCCQKCLKSKKLWTQ